MFCTDQETNEALNSLTTVVQNQARPLVIWVGAGVSTWAGYPFWLDLAAKMHTMFSREERGYDKALSSLLLNEARYPELFEHMRIVNQLRYFTILSDQFRPKYSSGVYLRFIRALRQLPTACIVTTNVDEVLEHSLPEHRTVQRSDMESIPQLLHQQTPFICKLHGSASSVESMVFSARDYEAIKSNNEYLDSLQTILSNATVLFLGYGLRDEYVLQNLDRSSAGRPLFGTGPHYIVTAEERIDLPETVKRIRYVAEVADHRDTIQILEVISDFTPRQANKTAHEPLETKAARKSLYFIADLLPPGKWTTSQTMSVESSSGLSRQMIIGDGYIDGEIGHNNYSALHDIVVGLICFDIVCVSIEHLARLHDLLGSEAFFNFVRSEAIRLVIPPSVPAISFPDEHSSVGSLGGLDLGSSGSSLGNFMPMSISERIRKQLSPAIGKKDEADKFFQLLESSIFDASKAHPLDSLSEKTHGALMNPSIRRMLGISLGTPMKVVPRWLSFPILRLAGVINCGIVCQHIHANSTRMLFGSEKLASVAFSATEGKEWADNATSYVLTGQFNSDVGAVIAQEPSLLMVILKFRESSVGESFRREVAQCLAADEGGQIVTAINAGFNQALPVSVLQQARDQLSGLFIPRNPVSVLTPAVWGDLRNSDARIASWRKRSRFMLNEELMRKKLGPYNDCPCGSGEKLKFCCQAALS